MIKDLSFGAVLKNIRMKNGLTLRKRCELSSLDPGNLSRLERNISPPPDSYSGIMKYLDKIRWHDTELQLLLTAAINHHVGMAIGKFSETK